MWFPPFFFRAIKIRIAIYTLGDYEKWEGKRGYKDIPKIGYHKHPKRKQSYESQRESKK